MPTVMLMYISERQPVGHAEHTRPCVLQFWMYLVGKVLPINASATPGIERC